MSYMVIPAQLNTATKRAERAEASKEASTWLADVGGRGDFRAYESPAALLPSGYSIGIRKPGKDADPNRARPIPYDMLPLIWLEDDVRPFDAGFNDICRALWDLGQASRMRRSEDAAREFGGLVYRNAWFLDHQRDASSRWRYAPPEEATVRLMQLPTTRIETPTSTLDMPASVFLVVLEVLALTEDVKYWFLAKERIEGATGRPNTLGTCARALACGLGYEHPMDFAYSLMRGRGVASLTRVKAREYFGLAD